MLHLSKAQSLGGTDLNSKLIVVIVMAGITYHLTGYVTNQREKGLLQLIDAMLPNKNRWQCVAIRVLSTHLAFDLIYAPGWIAMGGKSSEWGDGYA